MSRSQDSRWVVYELGGAIYIASTDGRQGRRLTANDSTPRRQPVWGPANLVAYIVGAEDSGRIATLDVRTGEERVVSASGIAASRPTWAPGGALIAHEGVGADGRHLIYLTTVSTGQTVPISGGTAGSEDLYPLFGPQSQVAFIRRSGNSAQLLLVNPVTKVERQLSDAIDAAGGFSWSNNGSFIAFTRTTGGTSALVLVNIANGVQAPIASDPALKFSQPAFSCASSVVLMTGTDATNSRDLYQVNLSGGNALSRLTTSTGAADQSFAPLVDQSGLNNARLARPN
jgi:Tol biopolymer transport system component